jgi:hypothetical protein
MVYVKSFESVPSMEHEENGLFVAKMNLVPSILSDDNPRMSYLSTCLNS